MHLLHRMIFLYHKGYLPRKVDHHDRDKLNNKIENLRDANDVINAMNVGLSKNNTSGYKGVSKYKGKWRARLAEETLGVFETPLEGAIAYNNAVIKKFKNTPMFLNDIKENYV